MENRKIFTWKNWNRKEYGRNAIIGMLGGGIAYQSGIVIIQSIGSVISVLGLICGLIWIYRIITRKN